VATELPISSNGWANSSKVIIILPLKTAIQRPYPVIDRLLFFHAAATEHL
jgi:hypothetical protein